MVIQSVKSIFHPQVSIMVFEKLNSNQEINFDLRFSYQPSIHLDAEC